MIIAAYIFLALSVVVILFQVALALGAPWGELTMGGRFPGRLPPHMRLAALLQALILLFFDLVVVARSQLAFPGLFPLSRVAIWFVVGYFVLGTVMNSITPSKKERLLWAPVTAAMLVLSLLVAIGTNAA